MKPCWKNKNDKSEYIIFSEVVLTEKEEFQRCLRMKTPSYH